MYCKTPPLLTQAVIFFSPNPIFSDFRHSIFAKKLKIANVKNPKKTYLGWKKNWKIEKKIFFSGLATNRLKLSKSPKNRFLDQYWSIYSHFSAKFWDGQNHQFAPKIVKIAKNTKFPRLSNLQRVARAWYESKKSKIAKNGFNNPRTIIVYDIGSIRPFMGEIGCIE